MTEWSGAVLIDCADAPFIPRRAIDPLLKRFLLAAVFASAACARSDLPSRLRRLPIVDADAIKLASESRPARLLYAGQRLVWTIPSSAEAVVRIGVGRLAAGDRTAAVRIRVRRSSEGEPARSLGAVVLRPDESGWKTWRVPWAPHRDPARLEVDVERGSAQGGPVAALIAEPLLVPSAPTQRRPDMIVFLVDTLRADRLGCYGDREARTPEFDALAGSGLRVARALSTADWTLPAHASLFTSTDVATHGAGSVRPRLRKGLPTLAETLQRDGYRTLAVTNGGFLDPQFGLARGFQRYFTLDLEREAIESTIRRAVDLIRRDRDAPFFLFFHTYQVHDYLRHHEEAEGAVAARRRDYDEQVTRTDAAFGTLRAELGRMGLGDDTVLLLTSDHGEILDDGLPTETAQRWGHTSPYLHENETRIPMILFDPRRPGRGEVLDRPISIVDVAPTVLSVLGLGPNRAFQGTDFSTDGGRRIPADRLRVTEEPYSQSLAVERSGMKLVVRPARSSLRAMWIALPYGPLDPLSGFDLRSDPRETRDLIPGPRTTEFDGLFGDASRAVAERFPGAVVVRIPSSDEPTRIQFEFDSGVRRWQFFSGGEPSRTRVDESARGLAATVAPAAGPGWLVVEPRRRRDGFACSLVCRSRVFLGNGQPAASGDSRWPWSAMAESNLPRDPGAVVISMSRLDPEREDASEAKALPEENLAQLRSLGYLNFRTDAVPDRAAPLPGTGTGVFRIRWQPETFR